MAFFNDFKEKFNKAAQSVTNKTKDGMEISRLASEGRGISNEITDLYGQIGRIYVESKGMDSESLAPLCARIEELKQRQEELERQKMLLKNQNRCPSCGAGMPKSARFCSSCGRRMPENTPAPEAAPSAEEANYCPECGAMCGDGEDFCAVCGHRLGEAPEERTIITRPVITRPIIFSSDDNSDEAPTDFEAD